MEIVTDSQEICPKCKGKLLIVRSLKGQKLRCPNCKYDLPNPRPSAGVGGGNATH